MESKLDVLVKQQKELATKQEELAVKQMEQDAYLRDLTGRTEKIEGFQKREEWHKKSRNVILRPFEG